jgi:hypothetical protein
MAGSILHFGANVLCAHGGQAMPTAPVARVLVSGQPVATITTPYAVVGCPFVPPAAGPCVSGQWTVGATRVLAMGQPVATQVGASVCAPTGTPLVPVVVQPRVIAM